MKLGPARFVFNRLKPCLGKEAYLGGAFGYFTALIGASGVMGVC